MASPLSAAGIKGGSAKKHAWTEEEREIVRRDYRGNMDSARLIAIKLGVTTNAVRGQIAGMGIAANTNRQHWNPKQDEILRELMGRYASGTVAKRMHRSINSVVVRAKRLRISARNRDGWYTKQEVCEILGVDHKWVQCRIDSGALHATYHNGHRPSSFGMAMWHIEEKDLKAFIRRYPQELSGRNVDLMQLVDLLAGLDYRV